MNAKEYNFTITVDPTNYSNPHIPSSGQYQLQGIMTIPDMFIKKENNRRRLKETPITTSVHTPAPTNKVILPVMVLIHPEGIHFILYI